MPRLARHLFTACWAVSLVLCVALGAAWIDSPVLRVAVPVTAGAILLTKSYVLLSVLLAPATQAIESRPLRRLRLRPPRQPGALPGVRRGVGRFNIVNFVTASL